MTTLTRCKNKPLIFLLLLFILSSSSCRKDDINTKKQSLNEMQLIKQEVLLKYIENNRSMQLLTLDWSKAKQTTIGDKKVVRIPTLHFDKTSILHKNSTVKLNKLSSNDTEKIGSKSDAIIDQVTTSSNFYVQHPPEVFFIQETTGKVNSFLLNFVPNDTTREFGKDRTWTGKLFEWNMKGDTVLVQDIKKSKLAEQYALKRLSSNQANNSMNNTNLPLTGNFGDKKVSNFWSDLWDALADFVGWIGSAFGLSDYHSGWYNGEYDSDGGWRLNVSFDWLTGGGGGSGGGDGGSYTGAGYPIYDSYIPGYYPPTNDPYSPSYYDSYQPYPHGPNGGGQPVYSSSIMYLMNFMLITPSQLDFLVARDDVAYDLEMYFETNNTLPENVSFAEWALEYRMQNPMAQFGELIQGDGNYFIMDLASQSSYPRFTQMVKGLKAFVKNDQKVLDALKQWSGFSETQILDKLTFGKGPKIVIKDLDNKFGYFSSAENINVVNIDASWVRGLEAANLTSTKQATGFLLAVTVLHEFVHQARAANGLDSNYEYGQGFENSAFGLVIYADNAGKYAYRFYGK